MTSTLRRVYHITAFSWYAFVVKSLAAKDGEALPPGIFPYGGPWKYLTFLNLVRTFPTLPSNNSSNTLLLISGTEMNNIAFYISVITNVILWTGCFD